MNSPLSNEILLDVKNLQKFFPIQKGFLRKVVGYVRAVDDVTFHVRKGETLSLVGESGCGKTTTARCIVRALQPTSGQVLLHGPDGVVDIAPFPKSKLRPFRRQMQMIFQDPFSSLNPRMTLFDIVSEPMLVNGIRDPQVRMDRVAELLKLVGLRPEYMRRYPHAFSGGERQRIGIARALALNPSLVIADEPVSALDVSIQAQVINLLEDLQAQFELTYLFIAHDLSVVKHISNRVAVMYLGKIVEMAPYKGIIKHSCYPYTKGLMHSIPIPGTKKESRWLDVSIQSDVAIPLRLSSVCYFNPRCKERGKNVKKRRPLG